MVVGGAAATVGTTSDSREGVKASDGDSSAGVVGAAEEDPSHRVDDSSSHQKAVVVDTTVAMDTTNSSRIATETKQESSISSTQPASPVREGEVFSVLNMYTRISNISVLIHVLHIHVPSFSWKSEVHDMYVKTVLKFSI